MRLTTVILIASMMQVSAAGFAQKLTFKATNGRLKELFTEIKKQTEYNVVWNADKLKSARPITVNFVNLDLEEALKISLANQKFTYTIEKKTIVISDKAPSVVDRILSPFSFIDVRGLVVDENDKPLVGATVRHLQSGKTVLTDKLGNFTFIGIAEDDVLEITFLGYKTVEVKAKRNISTVKMAIAENELGAVEVVSTGYQTLAKKSAPGTIERVGQEVLANRPNTDLSSMLQGVVAGMQGSEDANGNVSFTIRGISTLGNQNNQRSPLIVIDGFPLINGDFSALNPNDVESVDVLKDAAAAAIWGARSGNGVIVITTKKGKGKQGVMVDVSSFTRLAQRPNLDQIYTIASAADQVAYEKMAFDKKIYPTSGFFYQGGLFPSEFNFTLTQAQQLLFGNLYGRVSTAEMNAGLDALSRVDNRGQIQEYLMQRALTQQHNVSFSNNTEKANTYLSLLFEDHKGRFIGNGYRKYDINFSNTYKLTKFLTFNFNTFLQYNGTQNSGATQAELNGYPTLFGGGLSAYELLVNPDGSYAKQAAGGTTGVSGPDPYILSQLPLNKFPYPDWSYNLLREVRGRDLQSTNYNARIQAGLTFNVLPGLKFDTKLQIERGKTNVRNYYSDDTYYVRNMVNTYLQFDNATKTIGNVYLPKGGILHRGSADQPETDISSYNVRGQLSYIRSLGQKFDINAVAGGEIAQYRNDGVVNPWLYGYNPNTLTSVVPPYGYGSSVDIFRGGMVTGGNLNTIPGGNTSFLYELDRYLSYFAATNLTYNKKYTLSLSIRGDASNYITSNAKLRWSPFWSVGANWDVKAEDFLKASDWLDYLHLRASYGRNGTADKSTSTEALVNVSTSPNVGTGTVTATISSFGNPYLHWERTHITNLGIDFGFLKNKLTGNINLYHKRSTEVTGTVILPDAFGTPSQKFNNAEILNKGIEIQLGTSVKLPVGFGYQTAFNYAYNYNRVTDLYYPTPRNIDLTTPGNAFVQGRPINSFYTYNYAGVDASGMPLLYGLNGATFGFGSQTLATNIDGITAGYMHYAGTTTPPHTLGWRNTIAYGNFSLTAQLIGTFGGHFLNPSFNYGSAFVGYGKTAPNRFVRQVLDGDPSVPPILADPALTLWPRYSRFLTTYIQSSSYVQLKEVFLNYTLPQRLLSKAKLRNVNVFLQARDLGMIWNNNTNGYHPDFLPGVDRPVVTYSLGAKFGF